MHCAWVGPEWPWVLPQSVILVPAVNLGGQAWVLQFWLSVPCPTHAAPLTLGNGELHRRVRDWVPVAQVLEHALHAVKDDQPPLMALTPEAVQSPLTLWFPPKGLGSYYKRFT